MMPDMNAEQLKEFSWQALSGLSRGIPVGLHEVDALLFPQSPEGRTSDSREGSGPKLRARNGSDISMPSPDSGLIGACREFILLVGDV